MNYKMVDHGGWDVPITTRQALNASQRSNVSSRLVQEGELGDVSLPERRQIGEFASKADIPSIQEHQTFNRARETTNHEYFFIEDQGRFGDALSNSQRLAGNRAQGVMGIRNPLQLQKPHIEHRGLAP
jgi:hypothetical protein